MLVMATMAKVRLSLTSRIKIYDSKSFGRDQPSFTSAKIYNIIASSLLLSASILAPN